MPEQESHRRRGVRAAWSLATWPVMGLACGAGLMVLYLWAVRTEAGQRWDIELFARLQSVDDGMQQAASTLRWLLPAVLAVPCAMLAAVRLRARSITAVVAAVLIGVLSVGLARVLRLDVLERPELGDYGYAYNTYPSGHVAATAALAVAVLILTARRWRLLAAVGVVPLVALACVASVIGHAHRPSDVLGAVLLVGSVTGLVLALLPACVAVRQSPG